jgi:hypothetical protein
VGKALVEISSVQLSASWVVAVELLVVVPQVPWLVLQVVEFWVPLVVLALLVV